MLPSYIGLLGAFMVCLAYGLLQLNLNPKGLTYNMLNLIGSILLFYSLLYNWNLGSVVIEVFWFVIALIGLSSAFRRIENQASKSSYLSELIYEPFGEKNYKLLQPFTFYYYTERDIAGVHEHSTSVDPSISYIKRVTVPDSFITDFATIPTWLRFIFSPEGLWSKAAVLHDYLYRSNLASTQFNFNRKDADVLFLLAMQVSKVPFLIRYAFYFAVRLGGKTHYEYYRNKDTIFEKGQTVILDPSILGYESVERMVAFEQAKPEIVIRATFSKVVTESGEYCAHALIHFKE